MRDVTVRKTVVSRVRDYCRVARDTEMMRIPSAMQSGPVYEIDEQIRSIQVPTLIVARDHDPYNQTARSRISTTAWFASMSAAG